MGGNYNMDYKITLILEGFLAFAALTAGVAFFGAKDAAQPVEKVEPAVVISQPPVTVEEPVPEPEPVLELESEPEPVAGTDSAAEHKEKEYIARKAVYVGINQVLDGSALNTARSYGADAIIVNMKHDSGNLNWASEQKIALRLGLSSGRNNINQKLKEFLANEEFHMVARISAFKDRLVGAELDYTIKNNTGNYWTDEKGLFWTSVGNADIREYIIGCAVELAELGFDEIMVENAASPDSGYLDPIPEEQRFDAASEETFLNELADAVAETDAYLSIKVNRDTLTAEEPVNSLTTDMVLNNFDHCWKQTEGVVDMMETIKKDDFCNAEFIGAFFDGQNNIITENSNTDFVG